MPALGPEGGPEGGSEGLWYGILVSEYPLAERCFRLGGSAVAEYPRPNHVAPVYDGLSSALYLATAAQAILLCKDAVKEPFAVINADNFYGKQSYTILSNMLKQCSQNDNTYAMVGFKLLNTLSAHGHVARGVWE